MHSWLKIICCLLLTSNLSATYIYEANQSLIDLTNQSGTTNLNAGDDQVSAVFNLGFTFDFYGQAFTQGRIATNGCLHFKTSGAYCNDYTPDPLASQYTYTMLPFWTDLIRDNDSKMLAKAFSDKTVFGWYDMREYNRASDNSFEVILWTNDSFEFRYGALDIINHDVLIGEVGSGSSEVYQYLYHDECNTGSTNSSSCINTNWNDSSFNTMLENGGSLFGSGSGNGVDCGNPLNDVSCTGYWEAYDDQQCDQDPQYAPFCRGYNQEDSVAYFEEETDYGYQEEDMWYDEEYDEWLDPNDPCYENRCEGFTDADWYELDVEQFGQEQVDEWMGSDISFSDDGMVDFETTSITSYDDIDVMMDVWDIEQEQHRQEDHMLEEFLFQESFLVEDYREPTTFIELETIEQLEEWFEEETEHEERMEEEFAELDEPEEEFIEEIYEEEAVEEIFEAIEERVAEAEAEEQIEREEAPQEFEEAFADEFQVVEREEATGKSSISRDIALRIVSSTITTAQQSVSGTTAGTSVHANGTSSASGNSANGSSTGGISTSSSPSMSDQFASSTAQTNEVLDMSSTSMSTSSISSSEVETETTTTSVEVADASTTSTQDQMDVSISSVSNDAESDSTVANIVAQNLQNAQEDVQAQQQETGEYGSENSIIAVMGFVPGFNNYRLVSIPEKEVWYEPKSIYTSNNIEDNRAAFYQLAGSNIRTLTALKEMQPTL